MKYVASVVVDGIDEAGVVTNILDAYGHEVFDIHKAASVVIQCSRGYIPLDIDCVPIFTVH